MKLGCAFTRFQTKYFQGKYGDLDTNLVSYGPCQTPTLWFCVRRSDEINSFQPESYYTIDVAILKAGRDLDLQWDRGQVFDMPIASMFMNLIQDNARAVVTEISQKEDRMARPQALNTVAMLKMASTRHGTEENMSYMQRLRHSVLPWRFCLQTCIRDFEKDKNHHEQSCYWYVTPRLARRGRGGEADGRGARGGASKA